MIHVVGYLEYIGGIMIHVVRYDEYIGGIS